MKRIVSIVVISLGFCVFAANEDVSAPSTNIEIEVVASPIAQSEEFTADGAETVTIGAGQMSRLSAQDLQTALRQIPGVTVSRYSPIGSFGGAQGGSVYVRGTGESRPGGTLTVLQDGVPTVGAFFNHPLLDLNPIDFSEAVTVTKTPRSRGVVNAFSSIDMTTWRRHDQGWGGDADAAFGRFDTFVSSVKAGVKEGPVDAAAGAYYRTSEGSRDHNASEMSGAFARAGVEIGETEYLTFIYHRADSKVQDPGAKDTQTPRCEEFGTNIDTYTLRLESDHEMFKGHSMGYFTDGQIRWHKDHCQDGNPRSPRGWSMTDWFSYGYRGLYDFFLGDFTLSVGLDEMVEEGESKTYNEIMRKYTWKPGKQRQVVSAPYLGVKYDFHIDDDLKLTPSVGTRYCFCTDFDGEWTPSAAIDLGYDEYGIFASWNRGVHFPGLVFLANRESWKSLDCNAEVMDTFTTGLRAKWNDIAEGRLSVYHNHVTDRLDQDVNGFYHNAGELDATGVESMLRVNATDDLGIYGGVAFAAAQQKYVSRLPRFTATLGASWKFLDYLHLDVDAQYVDKMYAYTARSSSPSDLSQVPRFWIANVRLALDTRVVLPIDGEWFVACENVFDRRYEYFPGYVMPGAMFYAGMKIKF